MRTKSLSKRIVEDQARGIARRRVEAAAPRMLAVLKDVEICARVNSPIYDGSPMYKAIIEAIALAEEQGRR